jgi:nucleotide-binding universal stress UspA family protein
MGESSRPNVVIVDMTSTPQEKTKRIVVGVDGSQTSTAALLWAADEAQAREARLVVVHAWAVPAVAFNASLPTALMATLPDLTLYKEAAEGVVERALESIDVTTLPRGLDRLVIRGAAPEAILGAAEGAELIVVGSRGRSGLGELLLGSVSRDVVRNSSIPVVVVPSAERVAA